MSSPNNSGAGEKHPPEKGNAQSYAARNANDSNAGASATNPSKVDGYAFLSALRNADGNRFEPPAEVTASASSGSAGSGRPPSIPEKRPSTVARASSLDQQPESLPLVETPTKKPGHRSQVSWGQNSYSQPPGKPGPLLSPNSPLSQDSWSNSPVAPRAEQQPILQQSPIQQQPLSTSNHARPRTHLSSPSIDFNYVDEAQANILRALDQQANVRARARTLSGGESTRNILPHVPESAHGMILPRDDNRFPEDNDDEDDGFGGEEKKDTTPPTNASQRSQDSAPLLPQASAHNNTSATAANSSKSRLKTLVRRQMNTHKRVNTVEETLAALTFSMDALHARPSRNHDDDHSSAAGSIKTDDDEHPITAADPGQVNSANAMAANIEAISKKAEEAAPKRPSLMRTSHHIKRLLDMDPLATLAEEAEDPVSTLKSKNDGSNFLDEEDKHDVENPPANAYVASRRNNRGWKKDKNFRKGGGEKKSRRKGGRGSVNVLGKANDKLKEEWDRHWQDFFAPTTFRAARYIKIVLFYLIIPAIAISAILYYFADNVMAGITGASVSWWLLFVVRQLVTFSLALAVQAFIIDFLCMGTQLMLRCAGPIITLLIVQSKGWPFVMTTWAVLDFLLLAGGTQFANHWGFWQRWIGLFNEQNPHGEVTSASWYLAALRVAAVVGAVVAVKRFLVGLYLGRQTFTHYGQQLAQVMKKMLLIGEVATLGKEVEKSAMTGERNYPAMAQEYQNNGWGEFIDDGESRASAAEHSHELIDMDARDPLTGSLKPAEKAKLMHLLGAWEEPSSYNPSNTESATISAVLRFRKALMFIQKRYPFSHAFGPADTRELCVENAQQLYYRLMMRTPIESDLPFETLALLAIGPDGDTLDQQKAKELVRLLRPDREGYLTLIDFVRSVDAVYREFRLLSASIVNSSQIDQAFEDMFNVVFYIIVAVVVLSQLGFDPMALFLSLSSVILAFAFMIGSASAKYFEGLLFILVRRPYGIGDRINVSPVDRDIAINGSQGWIIEHVTLFETVARCGATQERCSLSNGSLASSRIINHARSPQAQFVLFFKFPIGTPYSKIQVFRTALEEYMKSRPREWLALSGFRANNVVVESAYIEYIIVYQHRESWQNIGLVLESRANFISYCNEVAKQLEINYTPPHLPVDLRYNGPTVPNLADVFQSGADAEAQQEGFRELAASLSLR